MDYFGIDYDMLNARSMIHNEDIREALDIAADYLTEDSVTRDNCLHSVTICKLTFEVARGEVQRYITGDKLDAFYMISPGLRDYRDIGEPLAKLMDRTNEICKWVTLLTSGVDLAESKRFDGLTPIIHFLIGGDYCAQIWPASVSRIGEEEARWVLGFTTRVLIRWQALGFAMEWPQKRAACLDKIKTKAINVDVL